VHPDTKYARTADGLDIAYQVIGDGPMDLVYVPGDLSNLQLSWDIPYVSRAWLRLAAFSRLIVMDRRGVGLSDRVSPSDVPSLETVMDDLRVVLDSAGSERAVLFGAVEGGMMCSVFAATYPDRVSALVLYAMPPCGLSDPDAPWGWTRPEWEAYFDSVTTGWGTLEAADAEVRWIAPSMAEDPYAREWIAAVMRTSCTPSAFVAMERIYMETDIRDVLPTISVPTLVLHRLGDQVEPIEESRYVAKRIPNATLVELPGEDHAWYVGEPDALIDEIEEFVTGVRRMPDLERLLTTILFTDVVRSTEQAAELGDRRWREVLGDHHERVRAELVRYRGREVDTAGDGFLATFDGPARAVRCAHAIGQAIRGLGLEIRAGVHTGEVELAGDDIRGIAVHAAARVAALAEPGEVLVSRTVMDLVAGSGLRFHDRGVHHLKGVPGDWPLFAVPAS